MHNEDESSKDIDLYKESIQINHKGKFQVVVRFYNKIHNFRKIIKQNLNYCLVYQVWLKSKK